MTSRKLLFAPGPIRLPDLLKHCYFSDPPYFTTKEFSVMYERLKNNLAAVMDAPGGQVLFGTGSGSLGMQCCVSNFFNRGDEVIIISHGKYGDNWKKMCIAYGLKPTTYRALGGTPVSPEILLPYQAASKKAFNPKAVFLTHVETTTGLLTDLEWWSRNIRETFPDALIIVDAISSFLSEHLRCKDYDVVISASQKGLSCPPGVFFMTVSDRALDAAAEATLPEFYFKVIEEHERSRKNITTFTPASTTLQMMDRAALFVRKMGINDIMGRIALSRKAIRKALSSHFDNFIPLQKDRAHGISVFKSDSSNYIVDTCYKYGLVIGSGLRENRGKIFRIMHFGWNINLEEAKTAARLIASVSHPFP